MTTGRSSSGPGGASCDLLPPPLVTDLAVVTTIQARRAYRTGYSGATDRQREKGCRVGSRFP